MNSTSNGNENLTPMFRQYFELKERYPDGLLFFRCGDFYELYGQDAVKGAAVLEISLTSRECGKGERIEMAGVPYHALDNYLKLAIDKGVKVAICEQLEDPKKSKGLVKRDVTRVITSGTILDPSMLAEDENNFLMALASAGDKTGIAVCDVSTGELRITSLESTETGIIKDEIYRMHPSEVVMDGELTRVEMFREFLNGLEIPNLVIDNAPGEKDALDTLKKALGADILKTVEWEQYPETACASAVLVGYLNDTQKTDRHSLHQIDFYKSSDYMTLDATTWRNLELTHTIMERQKKGSLLWVMDNTRTGMGARLQRAWMEKPLINPEKINARLDAVEELVNNYSLQTNLGENLRTIYDLERITSKVIYGSANARDMLALKNSIRNLPGIKNILKNSKSSLLVTLFDSLDPLEDLFLFLEKAIDIDPPISIREGGIIRREYNLELDELREIRSSAKAWIADMERTEREKTGIKSLKIRFNNVFGYFIEVTRPNLELVPPDYIRKQTIASGERFISPELKEYESKVMGAEEKIIELEFNLFNDIRSQVALSADRIQKTSRIIGILDLLCSFAQVALKEKYSRPEIVRESTISIEGGRHPVVEKVLKSGFVPNDTNMEAKKSRFHMITGPNMSGKSTYLRQIGLITIMAQMGSFVPAKKAKIGIADRVFTRVGASDDLHMGKSTFLVEMSETANIIKNSSRRSLILLDEIGRGTSTYDGLSIAWAVSEYIHNHIGARTLFATHFHQLTELENRLEGVRNFRVDVRETGKDIIFLHRIVPGGTDKSYGIHVARLAGLPQSILSRAADILDELESRHKGTLEESAGSSACQLTFFDLLASPLVEEIKKANPDEMSPREALDKIYEWKNSV